MEYRPLPIGVSDFEKLITNKYCYVDKTFMLKDIIDNKYEITLFTHPRRFGKTLNMSMIRYFFENAGTTEDMVNFIQALFESRLKDNPSLVFVYKVCKDLMRESKRIA